MPILTIIPIADTDVPAVIALWQACGLTRPWNDPQADIALARATPSSDILIGWIEGKVAATAMVGTDGHRGYAYYVAVDPALQGNGHGRAIMDAAQAWVRDKGCPKLHLLVRSANAKAMALYEHLGFERDDAIIMGKRF